MSLRTPLITALTILLSLLGVAVGARSADASADRPASHTSAKLGVPRTYDDAVKHFQQADGATLKLRRFLTPSGNIYCAIKVVNMPKGCEINEGAVKDPDVCSGNPVSKYVGRIEFQHGRATPVCNTDTIREPGARTLAYGSKARFPKAGIKCLSESIGVTCISLKKTEGFFLHRGEYVIFNAG
jgi:hypothetical protein